MSVPQSVINICANVHLNSRYEHTIYFGNRTEQKAFFAGKVVKTFSAYSFIRKSWELKVAATMEEAEGWTYLFFQNFANGRTYYYFIENIEYINDGTVMLHLQLDVLQTYMHDIVLKTCFVERNHVADDDIGKHTLDEGLETGPLVDNGLYDFTALNDLCILVLSSINPNYTGTGTPVQALAGNYNGVFSGLKVWAVNSTDWAAWGNQLDSLSAAGWTDAIVAMWMYPKILVKLGGENTWSDGDLCKTVESFPTDGMGTGIGANLETIDGYQPKNKKLFCYPYNFIYCTNNAGGSAVYRYERFRRMDNPTFNLYGSISPEGGVVCAPTYDDLNPTYEEKVALGNFPSCAWDADVYKMWLAQNQNQLNLSGALGGVKIAAGAVAGIASLATGNLAGAAAGVGAAYSGAAQIAGLLAQRADMEVQPPQARGTFSSNVNITAKKQTFTFYLKSINAEHAKIIDDYFTMYGYRINALRVPSVNARRSFTYVKTIGCHIGGNFCNEDMTKIESIFDHGITFWNDGDRIGDYTQNNDFIG